MNSRDLWTIGTIVLLWLGLALLLSGYHVVGALIILVTAITEIIYRQT